MPGCIKRMADNYFTTKDAAKRLGMSVRSVQLWLDKGLLTGWKTAGGHRRITQASVTEALQRLQGADREESAAPFSVLVVEDDPTLLKLYRMQLAAWPFPVRIYTAPNGYEGLVMVGEAKPNLLICDLRLPGVSGFQIVRSLHAMERYATMGIVVVSGLSEGEVTAHGGLPERVELMGKPIDFGRLRQIAEDLR